MVQTIVAMLQTLKKRERERERKKRWGRVTLNEVLALPLILAEVGHT